jgi:hypothetical protein
MGIEALLIRRANSLSKLRLRRNACSAADKLITERRSIRGDLRSKKSATRLSARTM